MLNFMCIIYDFLAINKKMEFATFYKPVLIWKSEHFGKRRKKVFLDLHYTNFKLYIYPVLVFDLPQLAKY